MRNFMKIAEGLQIVALAHAVFAQPDLWEDDAMGATIPIWAGGRPQPAWDCLPQVRPMLFDLMRLVDATGIIRVTFERLQPGGQIRVTADEPVTVYEMCLHNQPGSGVSIGEETIQPETGQAWVWRVAPGQAVEKVNGSAEDSISLQIEVERL